MIEPESQKAAAAGRVHELDTVDQLDTRQFEIAVKKLATALSFGNDRSPFKGSGVEYVQSRLYQPGDPVRAIDWKVTARTGEPHVKEYEAPRQLPAYLLVDTSASMVVSAAKRSKYAIAVHIAAGLALCCLERLSPVGVVGLGSEPMHVRPSLSKVQIMQWTHRLRRYRTDQSTQFGRRLRELRSSLVSRSLLIVLSDLHDGEELASLKNLAQEHDVVVIQLRDPGERDLRGVGFLRATEAETGRGFSTTGRAQWLRQKEIEEALKRAGVDHLLIDTDQSFVQPLRRFLEDRGVLSRAAR